MDSQPYPDSMPLSEARARFFTRAALPPDGGYASRWVRVEAKPFPFYFPNTRSRVAAAKLHDLHHVATGYEGDWPGEAEIAAWEIAAGCGRYGWAWLLNLGAFTVGLFLAPRRVFRAFASGRQAETLYHTGLAEEALVSTTVGDLRRQLRVRSGIPLVDVRGRIAFTLWCMLGLAVHAAFLLAATAAVYWFVRALPRP